MYKRRSTTKASLSLSILRWHIYWQWVTTIGNNNYVSAKRSSWVEGQSPGWSETFAMPPKKDTPPASKKTSPSISPESTFFFYRFFVCLCNGPISPLAKGGCYSKSATDCPPMSSGCALPHHMIPSLCWILALNLRSETSFEPPFDYRRPETTNCSVSARCLYRKTFIDTV